MFTKILDLLLQNEETLKTVLELQKKIVEYNRKSGEAEDFVLCCTKTTDVPEFECTLTLVLLDK